VSRRSFAGYWEYLVDDALFTAPARPDHSGAGLFNERGELVGIGSLIVSDAAGPARGRLPGNMFVPLDLLPPILPELLARGRSARSERRVDGRQLRRGGGACASCASPRTARPTWPGWRSVTRSCAWTARPVATLDAPVAALWQGTAAERAVQLEIERGGQPQHADRAHRRPRRHAAAGRGRLTGAAAVSPPRRPSTTVG
jgi:serine protease Do